MDYLKLMTVFFMLEGVFCSLSIINEGEYIVRDPGLNVTFQCTVQGHGFDPFSNQLAWHKMVEGEKIPISTFKVVQQPFKGTGRYSIVLDQSEDADTQETTLSASLTVSGVELADNGTYRCELSFADKQTPVFIEHSMTVPVAMDNLEFYVNQTHVTENGTKTVYEFQDLEPSYVSCESHGGNPKPQVHVYRGRTEVTSEFHTEVTETHDGPDGLQTIHYKVKVTDPQFRATWDQTGERLKCVARIPKMPDLKQTASGMMDVKYSPKFECEKARYLKLPIDVTDYVMDCLVKGNPPVHAGDIYWTVINDNGTSNISNGEIQGVFAAKSMITDEGFLNVTLTIFGLNTTHFNTYHLRAVNSQDEEHFEISLGEATTTTSTTTTTTPTPSIQKGTEATYKVKNPDTGTSIGAGPGLLPTAHLLPVTSCALLVINLLLVR